MRYMNKGNGRYGWDSMLLKDITEGHNIFYKLGFDEYSQKYIMEIDNGQGIKNYYVITEDEYEKSRNNAEFMNMLYDECLKENIKGKRFYFSEWSQQNSPKQDYLMWLYHYQELFIGKSRKQIYQITVPEKSSEKEDIYVLGNMKLRVIYQDDICVKVEEIKMNV